MGYETMDQGDKMENRDGCQQIAQNDMEPKEWLKFIEECFPNPEIRARAQAFMADELIDERFKEEMRQLLRWAIDGLRLLAKAAGQPDPLGDLLIEQTPGSGDKP